MRISDNAVFSSATRHSMDARVRAQRAMDTAATGLKVQHPWDDPGAAALVARHRAAESTWKDVESTAGRAADELSAADGALDGVQSVLTRARELAVQMANSTYSAQERTAAQADVQGLLAQAQGLMNQELGGRYLFSGSKDGTPPLDAAGTYQGDTRVRLAELAPGVTVTANVHAGDVASGGFDGAAILGELGALATALGSNDIPGVRATLDGLDQATARVSAARSQAGSSQNLLDAAVSVARAARDGENLQAANLSEADVVEAATRLAQSQQALEAALTASVKSYSTTILNVLK